MFVPLVLLGVVLIVFGAFVLLRYSDRPGATVKWLGAELSSNGAGLPLIMLGVGCIAFAAIRFPPSGHSTRDSTAVATSSSAARKDGTCVDKWLSGIPRDRIDTVEAGMRDLEVIGSHQPLEQPFVLLLTDNGSLMGNTRCGECGRRVRHADIISSQAASNDCKEMSSRPRGYLRIGISWQPLIPVTGLTAA
jgi:hypothetical protein